METLVPWHFFNDLYESFEPTIAYCLLIYVVGNWFYNVVFGKPSIK